MICFIYGVNVNVLSKCMPWFLAGFNFGMCCPLSKIFSPVSYLRWLNNTSTVYWTLMRMLLVKPLYCVVGLVLKMDDGSSRVIIITIKIVGSITVLEQGHLGFRCYWDVFRINKMY